MKTYSGEKDLGEIARLMLLHELTDCERRQVINTLRAETDLGQLFFNGFVIGVEATLHAIESGDLQLVERPRTDA